MTEHEHVTEAETDAFTDELSDEVLDRPAMIAAYSGTHVRLARRTRWVGSGCPGLAEAGKRYMESVGPLASFSAHGVGCGAGGPTMSWA